MSLHLLLAAVDSVFFMLFAFTNNNGVHMGTLLSKMHLAIGDQIQCNFQEAILMKLSQIMKAFMTKVHQLLKYFQHFKQQSFSSVNIAECILPQSNSKPFTVKVLHRPPACLSCSNTRTFFPSLAKTAAAVNPPIPLPITITSRFLGTSNSSNSVG